MIVPNAPGHFSAYGMLVADLRRDFVRTVFTRLADAPFDTFSSVLADAEAAGRADMKGSKVSLQYGADMRYVGQEHAVTVDFPSDLVRARDTQGIKAAFDAAHEERYGYASPDEGAEIVSLRVSIIGELAKPVLPKVAKGAMPRSSAAAGLLHRRRFRRHPGVFAAGAQGGQSHRRAGAG